MKAELAKIDKSALQELHYFVGKLAAESSPTEKWQAYSVVLAKIRELEGEKDENVSNTNKKPAGM